MFFVGLDLGQRRDFSAVAVVEREEERVAYSPAGFGACGSGIWSGCLSGLRMRAWSAG